MALKRRCRLNSAKTTAVEERCWLRHSTIKKLSPLERQAFTHHYHSVSSAILGHSTRLLGGEAVVNEGDGSPPSPLTQRSKSYEHHVGLNRFQIVGQYPHSFLRDSITWGSSSTHRRDPPCQAHPRRQTSPQGPSAAFVVAQIPCFLHDEFCEWPPRAGVQ
jgi:hypothetical protein